MPAQSVKLNQLKVKHADMTGPGQAAEGFMTPKSSSATKKRVREATPFPQ